MRTVSLKLAGSTTSCGVSEEAIRRGERGKASAARVEVLVLVAYVRCPGGGSRAGGVPLRAGCCINCEAGSKVDEEASKAMVRSILPPSWKQGGVLVPAAVGAHLDVPHQVAPLILRGRWIWTSSSVACECGWSCKRCAVWWGGCETTGRA